MNEPSIANPTITRADTRQIPHILLVDDQPARLLTYESILHGLNVQCMRATSGHEALKRLLEQDFAVILLDVNMPGMDGFEVARMVHEHPRMERIPIIFITGVHVSELDRLRGYEVGAIDYISVPVVPEILRSKVAILVELYLRRSELKTLNEALAEARAKIDSDHAAAIAKARAELLAAFEHPHEATVVLEARRGSNGEVVDFVYRHANVNALHNLQRSGEDVLGKSVSELEAARAATVTRMCATVLATGQALNYDHQYAATDYAITIYPAGPETVVLSGVDVTERKRLESALHTSERRHLALVDSAPVGVVHASMEGRFEYVNRAFCKLLGYTAAELCELTWQSITHPEDLDEDLELSRAVIAGQLPNYTMEKRYVRKDGSTVWVELFGSFVRDEQGRAQQGLGVVVDISARKATEAALRQNQQRLLLAQKAAQLGTHDYDVRSGRIEWDARTRELWGIAPDVPVTYEMFASALHPDDLEPTEKALDSALDPRGKGEYFARYRVIHRLDGRVRWVEATGLVAFEDGNAVRLVGTVQDISARVDADQLLLRSEEQFRQIYRETNLGLVLLDRECMIYMANPAFCQIVARTEPELIGTSSFAITHPEDVEQNRHAIARFLEGEEPAAEIEKRYVRPDGSPRWVRINVVRQPSSPAQQEERLLAAVEDITERVEARVALQVAHRERELLLEAERTARNEAEAATRAKDEFLATLSHELRTPLSNVISWARVLQRKHTDAPADLVKGLNIIIDNAMTQGQLISDLLDMSRIVSGKIELQTRPVEVSSLIERCVTSQRPAAEAKDLSIEVGTHIEPSYILGDETRLQQSISNLLANSIKFTPAGASVPIRVAVSATDEHLLVSVSDPGEGIDPAFLPHIFGRFRQADGTSSRRHGGLGLGLAIVKQLVQMHGGRVSVHSDGIGRGATFTITLPRHDLRNADAAGPTEDLNDLSAQLLEGRTILVVEDQSPILEHLRQLLEDQGARVVCVTSAAMALKVLSERADPQIDLLLSDLGLPEMDGFQLIRIIRGTLGLSAAVLPAIAVSAFAREEDKIRSQSLGYQAHIVKPFHVSEIVRAASRLLGSDRMLW